MLFSLDRAVTVCMAETSAHPTDTLITLHTSVMPSEIAIDGVSIDPKDPQALAWAGVRLVVGKGTTSDGESVRAPKVGA